MGVKRSRETIDPAVFEPLFEGLEAVRHGLDVVRQPVIWPLDGERSARARKWSAVSHIDRFQDRPEWTESEYPSYVLDLAVPHRIGAIMVYSALWSTQRLQNLAERNPDGDAFHYFDQDEARDLQTPQKIFSAYDLFRANIAQPTYGVSESSVKPNIYKAEGVAELVATFSKDKVIDDKKG